MSTIVTRSGKGSPLTHAEVDANFTNLNTDKYQEGSTIGGTTPAAGTFTTLTATGQTSLGGVAGSESLRVTTPSATGAWLFVNSAASTARIRSSSDSGNTALWLSSVGSEIRFQTNSWTTEQFRVAHTASAVNYVQVTGAATGSAPTIDAAGSDATLALILRGKGSNGSVSLGTTFGTNFRTVGVSGATVVNYLQAQASATTLTPVLSVQGSDTNIDLALTPKGTGLVRFGTYTAGAPTATGYISIKAADGTTYKVLVGT